MGNEDVEIKLRMTADLEGGMQTLEEMDKTRAAAKKLNEAVGRSAKDAASSFSASMGAVSRFRATVGNLTAAFGLFGMAVEGVKALGAAIGAIANAIRPADAAATEFDKRLAETAGRKEEIKDVAKSYDALKESIAAAAEAATHQNSLLEQGVKNARDLEDAQVALAEQNELAGIDPKDPMADAKRGEIAARYANIRARAGATRAKEDVVYQRQKLGGQADAANAEARALEESLAGDDAAIEAARKNWLSARGRSKGLNHKDVGQGFLRMFAHNVQAFAKLDFEHFNEERTDEGDALREKAAGEAKEAEAEIKRLEAQRADKVKAIASRRLAARRAIEMRDALDGQLAVADVRIEYAGVQGGNASREASAATAARRKEIDAAAAKRAELARAVSSGETRAAGLRERIAFEEARAQRNADGLSASRLSAFAAENAYGAAVRGGNRREVQAAGAAMDSARGAAEEAKYQAERTAAEITATLTALREQLRQVEGALKQNRSRLEAAKEEV